MREYLTNQLTEYLRIHGRPLRIAIANTGGTIICLPNPQHDNKLEPVKTREELESILLDGADFREYIEGGLLEMKIVYHAPVDSSQMRDSDREPLVVPLLEAYMNVDGSFVIHGTDTATATARFLHFALPYYDPFQFNRTGNLKFNWTKPCIIISSQEPAATLRHNQLIPNAGSDADPNLVLGLSLIADRSLGEVGIITNNTRALRGTSAFKASESHIPPFGYDPGVLPLVERTAFGLTYSDQGFLRANPLNDMSIPSVVRNIGAYEHQVLTVTECAHLNLCTLYLDEKQKDPKDTGAANALLTERLKHALPRVILYASKGAGNVHYKDYEILKKMDGDGCLVLKVPFSGGRIPQKMHYNVPGGDIPGVNIEAVTARYKAQAVLALMDELKVPADKQKPFFYTMMTECRLGNEFLPAR